MSEDSPIITDLDFGRMYRDHQARTGGWATPPESWDARATAFDARVRARSGYIESFISRMDFSDCRSLIDIGCGNGALPLAMVSRFEKIIGIDYSPAMLDVARQRAAEAGASNFFTVLRAWEDDWSDLPVCDIAIASRSMGVMDLEEALRKIDRQARKRVYVTAPVGWRVVNPAVLKALGREVAPTVDKPDYIYFINLLYRMNRMPKLDFIAHPRVEEPKADWESFHRNASFFLGPLSEAESVRLRGWREANPEGHLFARDQEHWAFIYWSTC